MMKKGIFLIIVILLSLPLFAQNVKEQRKRKEQLEEEISRIDKQLNANINKKKESVNTLILTQKKIEVRKNLISQTDKEIKELDNNIASCNANIQRLNARLDTLTKYYSKMVLNAYKMRDNRVWFMYILTGKSISQGMRRWSYLKNMSASINNQAAEIKKTKLSLNVEKEKLRALRLQSENTNKARKAEYEELVSEKQKVNDIISQLSKKEKKMREELRKRQKEVERLDREIKRILAQAMKEQKSGKEGVATDYKLSSEFAENKGKLPWPVKDGVIIEKFGQSFHPVFKNLKLPFNNGINISAAAGSKAQCVFDGVVKQVLVMPGYNQCVLVQHGEYFTFYCKLKMSSVKSGDKLKTGDQIGVIDTNSDGNAEIHFQLWKGTEKQNPEQWLKKR